MRLLWLKTRYALAGITHRIIGIGAETIDLLMPWRVQENLQRKSNLLSRIEFRITCWQIKLLLHPEENCKHDNTEVTAENCFGLDRKCLDCGKSQFNGGDWR